MKYYGNLDYNRVEMVNFYPLEQVNDPNYPIGFINQKGMLFEYVVSEQHEKQGTADYIDCSKFKKRKYKKENYYMGIHKSMGKEYYIVYKVLPRIANDNTFKWKENQKYGTKETVIIQGNFEFTCIVKADGDAIVDVRYTKCDNKHRNCVTITRIEVFNASNQEILNAIDEWKMIFKEEMDSKTRTLQLVG